MDRKQELIKRVSAATWIEYDQNAGADEVAGEVCVKMKEIFLAIIEDVFKTQEGESGN